MCPRNSSVKNCNFCWKEIDARALKCHHCNEDVGYHWRFVKRGLVNWISVVAIVISLFSLRQSFRSFDITRQEFNLKYFTEVKVSPVILIPHFEVPGEDNSQVWVTIVLKVTNAGSIPARDTELKYRIGGPCRGYFTNKDIEQYTKSSLAKFDLQPHEDKYFQVTFTDAIHCANDYLANKQYLEVQTNGSYVGMEDGKERPLQYSSRFRNNADQFQLVE